MNNKLVEKAKRLGKRIISLTNQDGRERCIFFTENEETFIVGGDTESMIFTNLPKQKYDELQAFHDNHRNQDDFSSMHSHPTDVTFSVGDIQKIKADYDEDGINHQFVVSCKHLYLIFISNNISGGLKFSKKLANELANRDNEIWKKLGINNFKTIKLKDGKNIKIPIVDDDTIKDKHNELWNQEFEKFFNRWNYINLDKLEYKIFTI